MLGTRGPESGLPRGPQLSAEHTRQLAFHTSANPMTAESNLPEELLVVILNCALTTPDSEFCRFPTPEQTCLPKLHSEILLVSKRWHRIGAPLLYARLRLATPEHVNAASVALKRHLDLGRAVRTLRLEGGYGEGLCEIAKLLPNAERLYVSLDVSGNIYGLGSALQSLNPKIVYVYSTRDGCEESRLQREAKRLVDVAIMTQWASLVRLSARFCAYGMLTLAEICRFQPSLQHHL